MECYRIRELLSGYIDGSLDPEQISGIRDHLESCERCSQEFAALKAVAESINSLEPVKAPEDFLERVHSLIRQRSRFKRVLYALFVPAPIKIPLECAGVLATALLVALLFGIPQRYMKKTHEGEKLALHLAEEGDFGLHQQLEQKIRTEEPPQPPSASEPLSRKFPPLSLSAKEEGVAGTRAKDEPIELVLVLRHDISEKKGLLRPDIAQDKGKGYCIVDRQLGMQGHGELIPPKRQRMQEEDRSTSDLHGISEEDRSFSVPQGISEEDNSSSDLHGTPEKDTSSSDLHMTPEEDMLSSELLNNDVSRIRATLESVRGRNISTEYDPLTCLPNAILAEIPAERYGDFIDELAHIGTLEKSLQSESHILTGHIRVRIKLLQPR